MHRASHARRSSDPRQTAPPVVVSLAFTVVFVAFVTLALAALTAPWLVVAFVAGVLTALAVHVVRTRLAARGDSEGPSGDRTGHPV